MSSECATSALRDGANVVLAARTADTLERTAGELDPGGGRVGTHVTDITDAESCEALVQHTLGRFGSVDALIQVAAYENVWGGLHDLRFEAWRKAFETNVIGALTVLRPVATAMKAGGGGCNMVVPSWMWGPNVELYVNGTAANQGVSPEEVLQGIAGKFPLRRMTEDGEVADVAVFFASDYAKAVTGQHLMVNSGEMMR